MAKTGGRVSWIAWPVALACLAIVGMLGWLAVPAIPTAVDFVGSALRGASTPSATQEADTEGPATDCRSLYPNRLWGQLTWTPDVLLSQNLAEPPASPGLIAALSPRVVFTCSWRAENGDSIVSSVSDVGGDAATVAAATLSSEGFACTSDGTMLHCERTDGDAVQVHDIADGRWLASTLTGWQPEDYASLTASRAFAG